MKFFTAFFICLLGLSGYGQQLVKDLNTGPKGSNPKEFVFGATGYTYFIAKSYNNSYESQSIWYSYQGGAPILVSGTEGASELVFFQNSLYFITDGAYYGAILKKLGTSTGSVQFITYIFPQTGFEYDAHDLVASGDKMYFFSNNSLWVSQGTEVTTLELSSSVINPQELTAVYYQTQSPNFWGVVFSAENSSGDRELYASTGSSVSLININTGGSSEPHNFSNIPAFGVLFSADNGSNGQELFKYNGSQATLVKNINPSGSSEPVIHNNGGLNNIYYLAATTANEGRELWKTDGTSAGTVLVEDIFPGSGSSDPEIMITRGGKLFFAATHPNSGRELWMSEGAAATTNLYQNFGNDIFLNGTWITLSGFPKFLAESNFSTPASFYIYTQTLVFSPSLYIIYSDSQNTSINFVKTLTGVPTEGMQIGSGTTVLFNGSDAQNGRELWKTDGTANGTALLKNIYTEPVGSYPTMSNAVNLNGTLIFSANDGINGRELFRSTGTAANTSLLKDCYEGEFSSFPKNLGKVGNYVYFSALGGPQGSWYGGYELWRTDGTANGTVFIKDINTSHISSDPRNFKGYNNEVYFVATTGGSDYIHKTNGTVGNSTSVTTVPIAEDDYAIVNGVLLFIKNNTMLSKQEVWQKNLSTGVESLVLSPASLFVSISHSNSNYAYLSTGGNIYSYNGTTLTNILSGFGNNYVSIGSNTYFTYNNSVYKTDGTTAGTVPIKSFLIDAVDNESIHSLVNVNGTLAFAVDIYTTDAVGQPVYRGYIYKSDGTPAGTVLVRSFIPTPSNSIRISLNSLTPGVGNELYYVVRKNALPYPPGASDRADYSRLMVDDLSANTNKALMTLIDVNAHYYQLVTSVMANNNLFFTINDHAETKGGFGNELWVYNRNCPANIAMTETTPPDMGRSLRAFNTVTSNAKIFVDETPVVTGVPVLTQVEFRAVSSITLQPGFEVPKNKVFKAEIGGCN